MSHISNLDSKPSSTISGSHNGPEPICTLPFTSNINAHQPNPVYNYSSNSYAMQYPYFSHETPMPPPKLNTFVSSSPSTVYDNTKTNHHHNTHHNNEKRDQWRNSKPSQRSKTLPQILQTSAMIHWPLSNDLLQLKRIHNRNTALHSKICRTHTGIAGLYRIGKYLWLQKFGESTEYHKVKARSFAQFMEWIPNQQYLDAWKLYASSPLTSEQEITQMLSEAAANKNQFRAIVINVFRKRLLAFMNVIKTLYMCDESGKHHTTSACTRCGKIGTHTAKNCYSPKHVNGKQLSPRPRMHNKKANNKQSKLCKFGMNCNRVNCKFMHKHQTECESLYCTRCKRTNHNIEKCHATRNIDGKELMPCTICGRNNHNHTHCRTARKFDKPSETDSSSIEATVSVSSRKRTCAYAEERPLKKRKTKHRNDMIQIPTDVKEVKLKMQIKKEPNYNQYSHEGVNEEIRAEKVMMNCAQCNVDLRHKDVWRCSKCKAVYYCGKQCQSRHWQIHKLQCGVPIEPKIKIERVSVNDWSCYSIIYWFNRLYDGRFNGIKYMDLRKHIVIGKLRGCELMSVGAVMLRMMGINNSEEQEMIISAMVDVVKNDDFDNLFANTLNVDVIPSGLIDPVLYELMANPVRIRRSGYIYDRPFVAKYIADNKTDPLTKECVELGDIVECEGLKQEIVNWTQKHLLYHVPR